MNSETLHTNDTLLNVYSITLNSNETMQRSPKPGYKSWIIVSTGQAILKTSKNEIVLEQNDRVTIEDIEQWEIRNPQSEPLCLIETEFDDND